AQVIAEAESNLIGDSREIGLCLRLVSATHHNREIDVAAGSALPAGNAAEDVGLLGGLHQAHEPAAQEPHELVFNGRLLHEQLVHDRDEQVFPVQLVKVGSAGTLHAG